MCSAGTDDQPGKHTTGDTSMTNTTVSLTAAELEMIESLVYDRRLAQEKTPPTNDAEREYSDMTINLVIKLRNAR